MIYVQVVLIVLASLFGLALIADHQKDERRK